MEQPVIATREVTSYILHAFKLRTHKSLGQNFLIDPTVVTKIAQAAELSEQDTVLEIGPGIGTLTQALAETGAQVVAVELDKKLLPVLHKTLSAYKNIRLVQGDILKINIGETVGAPKFKVAANLPYYITTPIIFALLEQDLPLECLVVMVQKEVAERIVAKPGSRVYGALSVAMQYYTEPNLAFMVSKTSFLPVPKVDSAVLVCKKRTTAPVDADPKTFFKVVTAAFSVRRKMLSNSLKNMGLNGEQTKAWLTRAGIDGKRRAETLSLEEFAALARTFTKE
jgi:16S rRNA (adenine1518-N6/adenine1519-N6)-dimethyltransferase